jgi:hypothetical protein
MTPRSLSTMHGKQASIHGLPPRASTSIGPSCTTWRRGAQSTKSPKSARLSQSGDLCSRPQMSLEVADGATALRSPSRLVRVANITGGGHPQTALMRRRRTESSRVTHRGSRVQAAARGDSGQDPGRGPIPRPTSRTRSAPSDAAAVWLAVDSFSSKPDACKSQVGAEPAISRSVFNISQVADYSQSEHKHACCRRYGRADVSPRNISAPLNTDVMRRTGDVAGNPPSRSLGGPRPSREGLGNAHTRARGTVSNRV